MKHLRMKKSSRRMSIIMEKMHLKYSFTVNVLCVMFALNVTGHILIIMVCVCPGLCFMKQASEANKLYVITGFSLKRSLCKSLLTLSEIGILNKGYYPTLISKWSGDVKKRPGQKILMPYPTTTCGPRCCFPILPKGNRSFPVSPKFPVTECKE